MVKSYSEADLAAILGQNPESQGIRVTSDPVICSTAFSEPSSLDNENAFAAMSPFCVV